MAQDRTRIQDSIRDVPRDGKGSARDSIRDSPRDSSNPRDSIRDAPRDGRRNSDSIRRDGIRRQDVGRRGERTYRPREPLRGTAVEIRYKPIAPDHKKRNFRPQPHVPLSTPQRGLRDTGIRIGSGKVQTSPHHPISPLDCERYKDSPFCGGNPFGLTPFGIEAKRYVIDACAIGIEWNAIIGFIKTPRWQIVIRRDSPECNEKDPPTPPRRPGDPPKPKIETPYLSDNEYYLIFCAVRTVSTSYNNYTRAGGFIDDFYGYREFPPAWDYRRGNYTTEFKLAANLEFNVERQRCEVNVVEELTEIGNSSVDSSNSQDSGSWQQNETTPTEGAIVGGEQVSYRFVGTREPWKLTCDVEFEAWQITPLKENRSPNGQFDGYEEKPFTSQCYYGRGDGLKILLDRMAIEWRGDYESFTPGLSPPSSGGEVRTSSGGTSSTSIKVVLALKASGVELSEPYGQTNWRIVSGLSFECQPHLVKPPNFNDDNRPYQNNTRRKRRDIEVTCCEDGKNEELLRQIKLLRREVGFGDVSLPDSLRSHFGREPKQQKIESLTHMLAQQIQYFDEIMGRWEIPIHVKDSDPTDQEDAGVKITIPNLSTAIGLLCQFVIDNNNAGKVSKIAASSALAETAQNKLLLAKINYMVEALIEYLGFKTEETTEQMPILCSLYRKDENGNVRAIGRPSEFLQNSHIEVSKISYKPSQKEENYQDTLFDLAQAAAIIRAVFWKRVDEKNPSESIKNNILEHNTNIDRLIDAEKSDGDFQAQLEFIENAYNHLPQRSEIEDPWGLPYSNRPKIKDISPGNQQGADSDGGGGIR